MKPFANAPRDEPPVALVTGGGSGIGQAIALALVARQCLTFIAGRTRIKLEQTAEKARSALPDAEINCVVADLGDSVSALKLVDDVVSSAGRLDVVVHAAATCTPVAPLEMTPQQWDDTMNVALRGTALCSLRAARYMVPQRQGRIVLITSMDQEVVEPGLAHYCAAKAGLAAFGRSLAVELARDGVCVNSVAPGWIQTPTAAARLARATPASLERLNALARPGDPEEIADVVVYLALDAPDFLTGETIMVDGGQTIKAAMP